MSSETKIKILAGVIATGIWIGFIIWGKADAGPLITLCQTFVVGLVTHMATK